MIKVNNHIIQPTIFPDGTSQIWKLNPEIINDVCNDVIWNFESERELFDLCSLNELLPKSSSKLLHIPYLPYGRQDKEVNNDSTFNLYTFAKIINSLDFDEVTSVDVHNPILTKDLINRFDNIKVGHIHSKIIKDIKPDYIVYPDLGARDRYKVKFPRRLIFYKKRDQSTGQITGHDISYKDSNCGYTQHVSDPSFIKDHEKFLILDDICDGGATFISIANKLKETGHKNLDINLFVTHGIFSKGKEVLTNQGIKLFTTNSLLKNTDGIEV